MIKRLILSFLCLIIFSSLTFGQEKLTEFSGDRGEYINQLETFMTSSKRDILEEVFEEYQKKFQTGVFSDEEFTTIIQVSNLMLNQRITSLTQRMINHKLLSFLQPKSSATTHAPAAVEKNIRNVVGINNAIYFMTCQTKLQIQ